MSDGIQFIYFIVAMLVTLTVHESSHALVAYYLGDPTAKINGRVSLNPLKHLDLIGSLVFLLTRTIGWAKPVPVNPNNFKKPLRDSALTALAGPASNFLLAFAIAMPWKYLGDYIPDPILLMMQMIFHVSIFLGLFNLFPFPPLDGSKMLGLIIPQKFNRLYQKYLDNGVKYFLAIILVDVFIVESVVGVSIIGYVMEYLHDKVSIILLLGT